MSSSRIPWTERNSRWRAFLDVPAGCYPRFVYGGRLHRKVLPVFHFHEATPGQLEPYLRHLHENGYRTLRVGEWLPVVQGEVDVPERSVVLCFDDAWSSVWSVVAPCLRKYGMHAVTFAIPGRVSAVGRLRPTMEDQPDREKYGDDSNEPFASWAELEFLDREGVIEVEAHTYAHAQVAASSALEGVWTAAALRELPLLSRPVVEGETGVRPYDDREAGFPRWITRSRMSDVRAWQPTEDGLREFVELFRKEFSDIEKVDPVEVGRFLKKTPSVEGRMETEEQRRAAIHRDLWLCKETLEERLGRPSRVLCFPWGIAGEVAEREAGVLGFRAAFADRLWGKRYLYRKADPFRLMRLKHQWLTRLPTTGDVDPAK